MSRCYDDKYDAFEVDTINPKTGRPRRTWGLVPPGPPPKGWCRLNPYYRPLPPDVSPAIRAKAEEMKAKLPVTLDSAVATVDGEEYIFQAEIFYSDTEVPDYTYPGVAVFKRVTPGAPAKTFMHKFEPPPGFPNCMPRTLWDPKNPWFPNGRNSIETPYYGYVPGKVPRNLSAPRENPKESTPGDEIMDNFRCLAKAGDKRYELNEPGHPKAGTGSRASGASRIYTVAPQGRCPGPGYVCKGDGLSIGKIAVAALVLGGAAYWYSKRAR